MFCLEKHFSNYFIMEELSKITSSTSINASQGDFQIPSKCFGSLKSTSSPLQI